MIDRNAKLVWSHIHGDDDINKDIDVISDTRNPVGRIVFVDDDGSRAIDISRTDRGLSLGATTRVDPADPHVHAVREYRKWCTEIGAPVLERNDCSRLHALTEALISDSVCFRTPGHLVATASALSTRDLHPFVVKQDWARAFANAQGIGEEFRLPYETCVFEFRVSGRSVNVLALEIDTSNLFVALVKMGDNFWVCVDDEHEVELMKFLIGQVRAACYAMDSDVATHSVIEPSEKLNAKRRRNGKSPLKSYHVVTLAPRRRRLHSSAEPQEYMGRVRLHFRRGHWRHLDSKKVWVRACLVGNPQMDWVEKEYSL